MVLLMKKLKLKMSLIMYNIKSVDEKLDFLASPEGQAIMKKNKKYSQKKKIKKAIPKILFYIITHIVFPIVVSIITTIIMGGL